MFCKKCGNQIDDNDLFCSRCGEKCSTDNTTTNNNVNEKQKISIGEKILRLINILAIICTVFVGTVDLFVSNILSGVIMLLTAILLIVFVFRKKQISKIKGKIANATARKFIITIIYLLLPIILFTSIGIGAMFGDSSSANPDEVATAYAESILKSRLKNPESLQIHSTNISVDFEWGDYHYYSITIDYSAQNGFGGYNRDSDYDILVKIHKTNNRAFEVTTSEYLDTITKYNNSK